MRASWGSTPDGSGDRSRYTLLETYRQGVVDSEHNLSNHVNMSTQLETWQSFTEPLDDQGLSRAIE